MTTEKQVHRSGALSHIYAQAVRVGNIIHVAGQVGTDANGEPLPDLEAQVRQIYAKLAAVLPEVGATVENVVAETWYVTDMAELMSQSGPVFAARAAALGPNPAVAQTLVQVSALFRPGLKVEVSFVAVV